MSSSPLVTVICSCYNHSEYVLKSLDAVTNQTYPNVELIVVDDCSSDNSIEIIENWTRNKPKVLFIKNSKNLGLNRSFNHAMKSASGKYFMDLAADDILLPNCIETLVKSFEKNPDLAMVYSNAETINEKDEVKETFFNKAQTAKIKTAIQDDFYQNILANSTYMCSVSALYNRNIFDTLNGYDENLYFEDFDYWLRISRKHPVEFIDIILVQKRFLENSMGNGFFVKSEHTHKLHTSFYIILKKAYSMNVEKSEYVALLQRIYKQTRWAIKTINVKHLFLYFILFTQTLFKLISVKKQ